ncbi:MAG TPA: hypothetical protein VGI59_04540 [Candidatus Udaeobacter sp.]
MNVADDLQYETSRKDLAAGILKQAVLDLRRFHDASSAVEREFYLDAHRWVTSDDCSWPFSFLNICQTLNLAPGTVREEVLGDLSLGAFGYWSRRCGRAARKFQMFLNNTFTNERTANAAESII